MKFAIIGGTGVTDSSFFENQQSMNVDTPFGSVEVMKADRGDNEVFFLERHTKGHKLTPSQVNYKGNIYALKKLGIDFVVATTAVGGVQNCRVGDFVILDQFIDFTKNRELTYFGEKGSGVVHMDMTEPYCSTLRRALAESMERCGARYVDKGTYVCTEGPRFETPAEINMFKILGGDVVGMTNVPEVVLAREMGLHYATISLVTNYAAGISETALSHKEVLECMDEMAGALRSVLLDLIDSMKPEIICSCSNSLAELNMI
ncbi:MAG: 6-oxopurine nucleoside phosphorylase [Firmicutes bacterium]|nr:6-oxopurine nucleoside phosphorylase [Bacillota bacterium]